MTLLSDIKHLIIDMDGVLYLGDQPMSRLCEFFGFLLERPIPFILATNNSTRTPQEYVEKQTRFAAGHRIRVTITCADKDTSLTPRLNPPPTIHLYQDVDHASYIVLPIIPNP